MEVKVVNTKFSMLQDAYLPLLVVDGSVDLTSSSYISQRFDQGHPFKTLEAEAKVIKKFYEFCHSQGIDFKSRLSSLQHFTIGETESLAAYYSARQDTGEVVVSGTFKLRWSVTRRFITFIWSFFQSRVSDPVTMQSASIGLQQMKAAFDIHGKTPYKTDRPNKIGLTPELKAEFLEIINPLPENEKNPWKSEYVRWRNYCLFLTMILGGNRKGESLGLKLKHFNIVGPPQQRKYYEIIKEDHEGYARKERPSVKTKGRKVELHPVMASLFEYFITTIRPKNKGAKKSEYLFLSSRDGKEIGLLTPNEALSRLIEIYPQFQGKLSPHRLRNTYFDDLKGTLDKYYESEGPIAKEGIMSQLMEYAGGWASGSQMPSRYAKGSIQRRVSELTMALQGHILEGQHSNG